MVITRLLVFAGASGRQKTSSFDPFRRVGGYKLNKSGAGSAIREAKRRGGIIEQSPWLNDGTQVKERQYKVESATHVCPFARAN